MKPKDPAAVALGSKGGLARKKALTKKRRKEIALKAGLASGKARREKLLEIEVLKAFQNEALRPKGRLEQFEVELRLDGHLPPSPPSP